MREGKWRMVEGMKGVGRMLENGRKVRGSERVVEG